MLEKQDQIFEAVRNTTLEYDEIFLLVTGDTAFSGKKSEYDIATKYISDLSKKISDYSKKPVHCLAIPGNHDCDFFGKSGKARQNQINQIQKLGEAAIDDTVIDQCAEIQSEFFKFRDGLHEESALVDADKLLNVYQYQFGETKIIFYCYNTAYLSELKEQPGRMYFPSTLLKQHLFNTGADLFISLFHHPFNWFNPINKREFASHIHETSDFYLTGHEHVFSKTMLDDLEDNIVYHVEGAVLQESTDKFESAFNLIGFDISTQSFKVQNYDWSEDRYLMAGESQSWINYKRGKQKAKSKYTIAPKFLKVLDDVGGKFTHPIKSNIGLSDVYVYPKLRLANSDDVGESTVSFILEDAESVVKGLKTDSKILFFGDENCGKTSLLRIAYKILHRKGFVPVYVKGNEIKSAHLADFKKLVSKAVLEQYGENALADYEQEDLNKVFILIDDIDKTALKNRKAKGRFTKTLNEYYKNIVLTGNELFTIEEIVSDEVIAGDLYANFNQYQILEFNHSYRTKLIRRWLLLGREDYIPDDELWRKCDTTVRAIEIIMGQKVVPNYPIFVLILLQAMEIHSPHDIRASSYANYYQILILKALTDNIRDPADLNTYQNYCAELAYFFFQKKTKSLSQVEHIEFHKDFVSFDKFDMPLLSSDKAIEVLCSVGILEQRNDLIEFRYAYTYYFFVAKYLAANISKTEVRGVVSNLCQRLHQTEFANIVMFLINFSNDELILDELLKNAKEVFSDLAPCKLEDDIKQLHQLVVDIPQLYLKNKTVDEVRDEENEEIDRVEEENKTRTSGSDTEVSWDLHEDVSEIDVISKLNLSFKLTEILGQTLRSNYGAMTGRIKYDLLKETYLMGLRTLNVFFSILNDNTDFVLNLLKQILSAKSNVDDEKVEKTARHLLFNLCSQMSYLFIKKISDSVGTPNLSDKYPKIQEELDFSSVQLVNFLIKLDHLGFPERDLKQIKGGIEKHPLSYYVLKRMVLDHLHRHPVDYKDKQRICEYLGIGMEDQRKIDAVRKRDQ